MSRKGHQVKTTVSMMVVLSMTLLVLTGCGTPFTNLCEQKGSTMAAMTRVLETVQDADSAQRAAPRMESLVARYASIEAELEQYNAMAEIGRMDEGSQRRFMQRYGELREIGDQFYAEMDRVSADPEMYAPLADVMNP